MLYAFVVWLILISGGHLLIRLENASEQIKDIASWLIGTGYIGAAISIPLIAISQGR